MHFLDAVMNSRWPALFRIEDLKGSEELVRRVIDMGLIPGETLEVSGRLPLGGPWRLRVQNTYLALRDDEVSCLILQKI